MCGWVTLNPPTEHSLKGCQKVNPRQNAEAHRDVGANPTVPIPHSLCNNGELCLTVGKTTLCGGGIGRH